MAYKLLIEDIVQIPSVLWQEATKEGFTDKTNDMEAWDSFAMGVVDVSIIQLKIIGLVISIVGMDFSGWNNLTTEQKVVACRWFSAPYALRVPEICTDEQDNDRWKYLIPLLEGNKFMYKDGRVRVYQEMWDAVSNFVRIDVLTRADSMQFYKDVQHYVAWYIYANSKDLIQWLTNEVGSPYENDGFAQKSYYNDNIKNDVTNIYNGNFKIN